MVVLELDVTQSHGGLKVLLTNRLGHGLCDLDGFEKRRSLDFVLADRNHWRRRLGRSVEHSPHGFDSLQSSKPSVVGAGRASALGVSQNGDAGIEVQSIAEHVLDGIRSDFVEVGVLGAFSDDNDRTTLAAFAVLQN